MSKQTKQTYETIYGEAGLIYLRAPAKIGPNESGQIKIKGSPFPKHGGITKQPKNGPNAGDDYTLKMGTEFKPGRWAVLLDFDNKTEGDLKNGMELVKKLKNESIRSAKTTNTIKRLPLHFLFGRRASKANDIELN